MPRSCAFSVSRRSSSPRGLKVYTFELPLGCQERSGASSGLTTSSLLFDRDVLFMRPPHCAVSWMVPFRDAKENLVTNRDDPFAIGQRCVQTLSHSVPTHSSHITHLNLAAWQVVAGGGCFFGALPLHLFRVPEPGTTRCFKQRGVKFVSHEEVECNMGGEGELLWLKGK